MCHTGVELEHCCLLVSVPRPAPTQFDFQAKPFLILWPPDCPPELAAMPHAATAAEKLAKANKLQAAAMKLQVSAQMSEVTGIMRKSPELVPAILQHARQLIVGTVKPAAQLVDGDAEQPKKAAAASPTETQDVQSRMASRPISRQCCKIEQLPVMDFRDLLYFIEPIAFSPFNIRALARRGAREVAKSELCKVLEYVTGVGGSTPLEQTWETMLHLAGHLKALSDSKGRRGSTLNLPPDWVSCGVYAVEKSEKPGMVKVTHRHLKATKNIDLASLGFNIVSTNGAPTFKVEKNRSDSQACIMELGGLGTCLLCLHFVSVGLKRPASFETPDPKARRVNPELKALPPAGSPVGALVDGLTEVMDMGDSQASGSGDQSAPEANHDGQVAPNAVEKGAGDAEAALEAELAEEGFVPPAPPAA